MKEIESKVYEYLEEEAGVEQGLSSDISLVEGGILDSFDIVAFTIFLSDEYGIKIGPLEVNLDNFDSIDKVVAFLVRKLSEL